jgi:hypothetical protein
MLLYATNNLPAQMLCCLKRSNNCVALHAGCVQSLPMHWRFSTCISTG